MEQMQEQLKSVANCRQNQSQDLHRLKQSSESVQLNDFLLPVQYNFQNNTTEAIIV